MKAIFTYPYNAETYFVNPVYLGESNTGLRRRISELLSGTYLSWNTVDPVSNLGTTPEELMSELGRYINYFDANGETSNISMYDFYNLPVAVANRELVPGRIDITADVDGTKATVTSTSGWDFVTSDVVRLFDFNGSWGNLNDSHYRIELTGTNTANLKNTSTGNYVRFYNLEDNTVASTQTSGTPDFNFVLNLNETNEFTPGRLARLTGADGSLGNHNDLDWYVFPLNDNQVTLAYDAAGTDLLKLVADPDQPVAFDTYSELPLNQTRLDVILNSSPDYFDRLEITFDPITVSVDNSTDRIQEAMNRLGTKYLEVIGSKRYVLHPDDNLDSPLYVSDLFNDPQFYFTDPQYSFGFVVERPEPFGDDTDFPLGTDNPVVKGDQYSESANELYWFDFTASGVVVPDLPNAKLAKPRLLNPYPAVETTESHSFDVYDTNVFTDEKLFTDANGVLYTDSALSTLYDPDNLKVNVGWHVRAAPGSDYAEHLRNNNVWDNTNEPEAPYFFDQTPVYDDTSTIVLNDPDGAHYGYFTLATANDYSKITLDEFYVKDLDWEKTTLDNDGTVNWESYNSKYWWNKIQDTGYTKDGLALLKVVDNDTSTTKPLLANTVPVDYGSQDIGDLYFSPKGLGNLTTFPDSIVVPNHNFPDIEGSSTSEYKWPEMLGPYSQYELLYGYYEYVNALVDVTYNGSTDPLPELPYQKVIRFDYNGEEGYAVITRPSIGQVKTVDDSQPGITWEVFALPIRRLTNTGELGTAVTNTASDNDSPLGFYTTGQTLEDPNTPPVIYPDYAVNTGEIEIINFDPFASDIEPYFRFWNPAEDDRYPANDFTQPYIDFINAFHASGGTVQPTPIPAKVVGLTIEDPTNDNPDYLKKVFMSFPPVYAYDLLGDGNLTVSGLYTSNGSQYGGVGLTWEYFYFHNPKTIQSNGLSTTTEHVRDDLLDHTYRSSPSGFKYATVFDIGLELPVDQSNANSYHVWNNGSWQGVDADYGSGYETYFNDQDVPIPQTTVDNSFPVNYETGFDTDNFVYQPISDKYPDQGAVITPAGLQFSQYIDTIQLFDSKDGTTADIGETIYPTTTGDLLEVFTPADSEQIALRDLYPATTGKISISTQDPAPYTITSSRLVMPGARRYPYGGALATNIYWYPGSTSADIVRSHEDEPVISTTISNQDLAGFSVDWGGRFSYGGPMLFHVTQYPDPTPVPEISIAEQQDIFDTADEWATSAYTGPDADDLPQKQWPTHVKPLGAEITQNSPNSTTFSQNGTKYVRNGGYTKWQLQVEYPPMLPSDFQKFHGVSQIASTGIPFFFVMRGENGKSILWSDFYRGGSSIVRLREPSTAEDTVLMFDGFASFEEGAFNRGETTIFKTNQNGSLSTAVNTVDANAYGEAKVRFAYPITKAGNVSDKLYRNPYHAVVTLQQDNFQYTIDTAGFYRVSVTFDLDSFK